MSTSINDHNHLFGAQHRRAPQFAAYEQETDRTIPVVVLTTAGA